MSGKNIYAKIAEYNTFGSKLGLERMAALCELLGDPQDELRVIHVAGTNGKGSVCRYIYEVLRALGYRAGLYASPFVTEFGERIEADGEMITPGELERVAAEVFAAADSVALTEAGQPTEFEVVTAMAFLWYARKNLDFVVLEVGLGGRGDSTNVVKAPLASVITSVSLDHTNVLGTTVAEIAAEKAGIIKAGCPVICGASGEAAKVVARTAYEIGAPLTDAAKYAADAGTRARSVWDAMREGGEERTAGSGFSDDEKGRSDDSPYRVEYPNTVTENNANTDTLAHNEAITRNAEGAVDEYPNARMESNRIGNAIIHNPVIRNHSVMQVVNAVIDGTRYTDIELTMAGAYQVENAVVALTAIESLRRRKIIRLTADGVRAGMRRAHLPGRMEIFYTSGAGGQPSVPIILDGAHNASGAAALAAAVRGYLPGANISTVMGVLADKDFEAMLRHLYWFSGHMFLTQPPNDRALEPAELADRLSRVTAELSCGCGDPACLRCSAESGPFSTVFSAPEDALNAAITRAQHSERGAVVVCGSLYLISAVRGLLM